MNELSKQEIIDRFTEEVIAFGEHRLETGHLGYRKGNKLSDKAYKTYLMFSHDLELANEILEALMDNEHDYVRSSAAGHAMNLGILKEKAFEVLHEVAKRNDIWGFDARTVIWVHANMSRYKDKQGNEEENVEGKG